jgi:hypothetical protein
MVGPEFCSGSWEPGVLAWWLWTLYKSPNRADLSTYWALASAIILGLVPLVKDAFGSRGKDASEDARETRRNFVDQFADDVDDKWNEVASERRLLAPIPIRWRRPSTAMTGPVSAAVNATRFEPLPGLQSVLAEQLQQGTLADLHALYGGLRSGRLLVVGGSGAGKSGAAVMLARQALAYRRGLPDDARSRVPIPVTLTAHGWDPHAERLRDWLAGQLQKAYPSFAGRRGRQLAVDLVRQGQISPILDGLDEIAERLQSSALQALSERATFRLVILCRSANMVDAAIEASLDEAAAIELEDVDPITAADYLTRIQLDPPPVSWSDLIDRLRSGATSPIKEALSTPLALTLVRDTYRRRDSVRELLELSDSGLTSSQIEEFMLDRVLSLAYEPSAGKLTYDLATARRILTFIARQLNAHDHTRDLEWWNIPRWQKAAPRIVFTTIFGTVGVYLISGDLVYAICGSLLALTQAFGTSFRESGPGSVSFHLKAIRPRELLNKTSIFAGTGIALSFLMGWSFTPLQEDFISGRPRRLLVT